MRDRNLGLLAVAAYHQDNQRFWPNRAVDGFRFGVVGDLFEDGPRAWLDQVAELQADGQDAGACGELPAACNRLGHPTTRWASAPRRPAAGPSAFELDISGALVALAKGDAGASRTGRRWWLPSL
jgi:hypothetical protein